ncbi:class I SAM-dependent methyltransferase [Thermohalobacter berrensis]|uniref:Methyltransferase type 11 domain-containing protein n=1 Tax=Thermohalobacter berrensis TaxID=99594 RepID=A0A419SZA8_9FIRM|nr:methyltransferase domain-containing protein [Thermohalobacter berrensis]RKD30535.1 hypothetical protein BET03_04140 [Thermohalobacter berrensis]
MGKKFKAKNIEKLDNPLRRKVLPPKKIIKELGIQGGLHIADVGCGIGYFTIPLAEQTGEKGKVYAIDINPIMLNEIKKRVDKENITNVEIIHSAENNFRLKGKSVDIVFTSTVLHEVDSPSKFLKECKRVLMGNGKLFILEWNKIEEKIGPPIHKRIDIETTKKFVIDVGFKVKKTINIGNSFYIVDSLNY